MSNVAVDSRLSHSPAGSTRNLGGAWALKIRRAPLGVSVWRRCLVRRGSGETSLWGRSPPPGTSSPEVVGRLGANLWVPREPNQCRLEHHVCRVAAFPHLLRCSENDSTAETRSPCFHTSLFLQANEPTCTAKSERRTGLVMRCDAAEASAPCWAADARWPSPSPATPSQCGRPRGGVLLGVAEKMPRTLGQ